MSRHKIVKNLDLDEELDDYDGGNDYDDSYGGADGGAGGVEGSLVPSPQYANGQRNTSLTCDLQIAQSSAKKINNKWQQAQLQSARRWGPTCQT
jgi:hypothetical protein